jgi:hypothetical protein
MARINGGAGPPTAVSGGLPMADRTAAPADGAATRRHILAKLDAASRTEAVARARKLGLIP